MVKGNVPMVNKSLGKNNMDVVFARELEEIQKGEPYIKKIVSINEDEIKELVKNTIKEKLDAISKKIDALNDELSELTKDRFTQLLDDKKNRLFYDSKVTAVYSKELLLASKLNAPAGIIDYIANKVQKNNKSGLVWEIATYLEYRNIFIDYPDGVMGLNIDGEKDFYFEKYEFYSYLVCREAKASNKTIIDYCHSYRLRPTVSFRKGYESYLIFPVAYLNKNFRNKKSSLKDSVLFWLQYKFVPEKLGASRKDLYIELANKYEAISKYLKGKGIALDERKLLEDVLNGSFKGSLAGEVLDYGAIINEIHQNTARIDLNAYKQKLLGCDYKRANLLPYDENQLTDLNKGHWDLTEISKDGSKVNVPENLRLVARPPQKDINRNGVCGIDFGTKSTVVAYYQNEARLLRVGKGDYTKAPVIKDYENPTVIELRDFTAFIKAYVEKIGRPDTEWEQMTVSHQAAEAIFADMDENVICSVFSELKQWAIDKNRRLLLCDKAGKTIEIKPYCELKEGDFDPIEIYAYYLGLYINNMRNGIYMHYVLSFPVNYEKAVREQLLGSFKRGLKKSLPSSILKDEKLMKSFKIYAGASEPAAYAISALQEFNLEPENIGEKVCYGVFDFGGGTTDFDFGIEEIPEDGDDLFLITQFGSGGDVYLGGENILLMLAYEVYVDNIKLMRDHKIAIELPPKCEILAGTESLIFSKAQASQAAYLNLRRLAENLRPIWERINDYKQEYNTGCIPFKMLNEANRFCELQLKVNVDKLEKRIEKEIENGVKNFFSAFSEAFKDKDIVLPIHIFLAGNSSKSPVVKSLFEKYIAIWKGNLADSIFKKCGQKKSVEDIFRLYMPLGTRNTSKEEPRKNVNKQLLTDVVVNYSKNNSAPIDMAYTGKTGVVFGLLRSRKGGLDVKIINQNNSIQNEAKFRYYIGRKNRKRCFHTVIGLDVNYNEWTFFVNVNDPEINWFELFYTSEPTALEGELPITKAKKVSCDFDCSYINESTGIYIRKVTPNKIEYAIGTEEDFKNYTEKNFKNKIMALALED